MDPKDFLNKIATDDAGDTADQTDAVPGRPEPQRVCSHCGGDKFACGVTLRASGEGGIVGAKYQASGKFLGFAAVGTEPLCIDLCNACGTIARLYVENANRKWSWS